ncbi:Lrp/AsnC family transcriptional regulator [Bradyrhizobium sp. USDA 4463]
MDETDRKLLNLIQHDAALSLDELSERAGLSRNACWRRIKRLEDDGIIKGRVTLLDASRINVGLTAFIALRTTEHSASWLAQFSNAVRDIPEIIGVYRMTGDVDYLLQAVIPDVAAYDRLYQRLIGRITLADVSSSFVMQEIKATTVLPLDRCAGAARVKSSDGQGSHAHDRPVVASPCRTGQSSAGGRTFAPPCDGKSIVLSA